MVRIFITGGSGFLGSFVAFELLRKNHEVVFLARKNGNTSAKERVDQALSFVDSEYVKYMNQYCVYEGDVTESNLGLSVSDIDAISNKSIDEVWHIAGSVSFAETDRDINCKINVNGTENLLNLISNFSPKKFFHVSTAFICGNISSETFLEEQYDCGQSFNNPYEETKFRQPDLERFCYDTIS